jgi:hypothetical protein
MWRKQISHHQLHHRKPTQPPRSHRDSLSLLLPAFLSPLQTSSCTVATPATKLSINAATSLLSATQTSSASHLRQVAPPNFCPVPTPVLVAIACRRYSACNGRIINLECGPNLIWPSPNLWVRSGPPLKLVGPRSTHPF